MGDSLPPPAAIDLVGSYARAAGADAELILWDPQLGDAIRTVTLARREHSVEGTVQAVDDAGGRRLVARVARRELSDGIWSITVRSDAGDEPIDARLLVQGRRPLVLLWGGRTSRSLTPKPRPAAHTDPTLARLPPLRKQLAAAGGRALDRGLSVLPPERARSVRGAARKLARRVVH